MQKINNQLNGVFCSLLIISHLFRTEQQWKIFAAAARDTSHGIFNLKKIYHRGEEVNQLSSSIMIIYHSVRVIIWD